MNDDLDETNELLREGGLDRNSQILNMLDDPVNDDFDLEKGDAIQILKTPNTKQPLNQKQNQQQMFWTPESSNDLADAILIADHKSSPDQTKPIMILDSAAGIFGNETKDQLISRIKNNYGDAQGNLSIIEEEKSMWMHDSISAASSM